MAGVEIGICVGMVGAWILAIILWWMSIRCYLREGLDEKRLVLIVVVSHVMGSVVLGAFMGIFRITDAVGDEWHRGNAVVLVGRCGMYFILFFVVSALIGNVLIARAIDRKRSRRPK